VHLGPIELSPVVQCTLVATGVCLSLDLQLDPVATAAGWWHWDRDLLLSQTFLGVPAVNFIAWFSALAPLFLLIWWVRSQRWSVWQEHVTLLALLLPLFVVELMLVLVLSWIVTGGFTSRTMILFQNTLGPLMKLITVISGAVLVTWAVNYHMSLKRHRHLRHLATVMRLVACSDVVRHCVRGPMDQTDIFHRLESKLSDSLDPHETFEEAMGHCLESGWIEGPPEARRATEEGREMLRNVESAVER
jgi:hypothetical protein